MNAMNLTDFLLARIAEQESRVRGTRVEQDDEGSWSPPERFISDPFRLAELEAKRRIMEVAQSIAADPGWVQIKGDEILALLALPYADHRDYRDEWRP